MNASSRPSRAPGVSSSSRKWTGFPSSYWPFCSEPASGGSAVAVDASTVARPRVSAFPAAGPSIWNASPSKLAGRCASCPWGTSNTSRPAAPMRSCTPTVALTSSANGCRCWRSASTRPVLSHSPLRHRAARPDRDPPEGPGRGLRGEAAERGAAQRQPQPGGTARKVDGADPLSLTSRRAS